MDFNLLTDNEARSPALSLSDSGTPQHDAGCKGQDNSGELTVARNPTFNKQIFVFEEKIL